MDEWENSCRAFKMNADLCEFDENIWINFEFDGTLYRA